MREIAAVIAVVEWKQRAVEGNWSNNINENKNSHEEAHKNLVQWTNGKMEEE